VNSQIIEVIVEGIKMGTSILLVIGITFGTIVVSFVLGALILSKKNKSGLSNQDEIAQKYEQQSKRRPLWKWN
jgi:hypothetical protein